MASHYSALTSGLWTSYYKVSDRHWTINSSIKNSLMASKNTLDLVMRRLPIFRRTFVELSVDMVDNLCTNDAMAWVYEI